MYLCIRTKEFDIFHDMLYYLVEKNGFEVWNSIKGQAKAIESIKLLACKDTLGFLQKLGSCTSKLSVETSKTKSNLNI